MYALPLDKIVTVASDVEKVCLQIDPAPAGETCIPRSVIAATFQGYKDGDLSPLATSQWQVLALKDERDGLAKQLNEVQRQLLLASVKQATPIGMMFDGATGRYVDPPKEKPAEKAPEKKGRGGL
jgi:hypothetical protein